MTEKATTESYVSNVFYLVNSIKIHPTIFLDGFELVLHNMHTFFERSFSLKASDKHRGADYNTRVVKFRKHQRFKYYSE